MRVMFIINNLGINEPFGPMLLSAALKKNGHQTVLGVIQEEDLEKKILDWKPDILAYSMMSTDMNDMAKFNNALKKRVKIFTILGGSHATLVRNSAGTKVDAICVGEAEDALVELIEHLEAGKNIQDLKNIPNIITSKDDSIGMRSLVYDLDTIPFMDRELIYSYPQMARFGIKGIYTSRGCVYPCPYCFNNRQNQVFKGKGKIFRRRSVDSVIKETKILISKYRAEFIRIQDDVFIYKVDDWFKEFAERWPVEIGKPFYCLIRSELITDEMARYLKKAGCASICMSIEAGDDDIRIRMMRRKVSKDQLREAFSILKKYKINVYSNAMLALPFTTLEHDIATVDFSIEVQPEMPNFSILMPYSGTDLGDYSRQSKIYNDDGDVDYGMRNMSPLTCFSEKEKRAQYNLCQLAIVAVKIPILRNLIVNHLIYWKPNKLFFYIHYIFAMYAYGRKIFYFKHTFREYIELIGRTFKHYIYDFFKKDADKNEEQKNNEFDVSELHGVVINAEKRRIELEKCMVILESGRLLPEHMMQHLPINEQSKIMAEA